MNKNDDPPIDLPASEPLDPARAVWLEAQIDERDETIRLLNEALSCALDELHLQEAA